MLLTITKQAALLHQALTRNTGANCYGLNLLARMNLSPSSSSLSYFVKAIISRNVIVCLSSIHSLFWRLTISKVSSMSKGNWLSNKWVYEFRELKSPECLVSGATWWKVFLFCYQHLHGFHLPCGSVHLYFGSVLHCSVLVVVRQL